MTMARVVRTLGWWNQRGGERCVPPMILVVLSSLCCAYLLLYDVDYDLPNVPIIVTDSFVLPMLQINMLFKY